MRKKKKKKKKKKGADVGEEKKRAYLCTFMVQCGRIKFTAAFRE